MLPTGSLIPSYNPSPIQFIGSVRILINSEINTFPLKRLLIEKFETSFYSFRYLDNVCFAKRFRSLNNPSLFVWALRVDLHICASPESFSLKLEIYKIDI